MERNITVERTGLQRSISPHYHVATMRRPSCEEHFIAVVHQRGESPAALFAKVADAVRQRRARIVSQDVFGLSDKDGGGSATLKAALGEVTWPVTWIENEAEDSPGSTMAWAITGARTEPVRVEGRILGTLIEDDDAQYCRLGGLMPRDNTRSRFDQTLDVFDQMEAGLRAAKMEFAEVVRTWFFNHRILEWYAEFNKARNEFFTQRGVYDGMVPASTGVAGPNPTGGALTGGLLALRPKTNRVRVFPVPSPLQCPALEYGSSFSRAVEIETPDYRRLLVSGTASIDPAGNTIHVGDVNAQIARTMDVVHAILESRGMGWSDVSRAVAYVKSPPAWTEVQRYCRTKGLRLPVVPVHEDICRDDLLFEIELDALSPT